MNERLQHNMTPNKKLLDVNVSLKKKCLKKRYNKHLTLIRVNTDPFVVKHVDPSSWPFVG
jgi:hypothetical protein